jgi:hypothetical protein
MDTQVSRARRLILSVGLAVWGLGGAVATWALHASPDVQAGAIRFLVFGNALILAGGVVDAGAEPRRATRQRRPPDPVAVAWSALLWYPIFPTAVALFALEAGGVLDEFGRSFGLAVAAAVVLFAKGVVYLSPGGLRLLRVDVRHRVDGQTAQWLPWASGAVYALAGAATFVVVTGGWLVHPAAVFLLAALAWIVIALGTAAVTRVAVSRGPDRAEQQPVGRW